MIVPIVPSSISTICGNEDSGGSQIWIDLDSIKKILTVANEHRRQMWQR